MTYFHVSSWLREAMPLGHIFSTSWDMSNYGTTQANHERATEAIFARLSLATNVLPTPVLRTIAAGKARLQTEKELLFEMVRASEFPDLPSRTNAMFLCESEAAIRALSAQVGLSGRIVALECLGWEQEPTEEEVAASGIHLVEFERLRSPLRHRANPIFLDGDIGDRDHALARARAYWAGERTEAEALTEVLFRGFFSVTQHLGDSSASAP